MSAPEKSRGHVAFWNRLEFFHGPNDVLYVAFSSNALGPEGYRQGAWPERGPQRDNHREYLWSTYNIKVNGG